MQMAALLTAGNFFPFSFKFTINFCMHSPCGNWYSVSNDTHPPLHSAEKPICHGDKVAEVTLESCWQAGTRILIPQRKAAQNGKFQLILVSK